MSSTTATVPVGILEQAARAADEAAEHLEERAADHQEIDADEAETFARQAGEFGQLARNLYAAGRGALVPWNAGTAVIEGPYGHWYAWHEGELTALPQDAEPDGTPLHPMDLPSKDPTREGWYTPSDLSRTAVVEIVCELDRLGEEAARQPTRA